MYYTRQILKYLNMIIIGLMLILIAIIIQYKPGYKVSYLGKDFGYIKNKNLIEETIEEYINTKENNIAFITLEEKPTYQFMFTKDYDNNEEEVLLAVKESAQITYRMFAIALDGENKTYVGTIEEAERVINEIKEEYQKDLELNITISEIYTENFEIKAANLELAKVNIEDEIKVKESSVNGIALSKPVTGSISSRFGDRSLGYHTGLDIGASVGTPIYACSSGTVTCSEYKGSYGNLIIISHGNDVETYYAHCSKLNVSVGNIVQIGDKIGEVGSTGRSTGPHLHLEIRLNGKPLNPQKYLYK